MNIENEIKDVITKKLEEGIIEKLVAENLEKSINKSLENLLGSYGDITKVIEEKIKGVMIEQLSSYDYSKYIVKLDYILTEILKNTALDNKKILENFKELMTDKEIPRIVKASDIFEEYKKYVAENVDTYGLEVNTDDTPTYDDVDVTMEVEYEDERSWSSAKYAKIILECGHDDKLNYEIRISKFREYPWRFNNNFDFSIESLRHLDTFKIYLLQLYQRSIEIKVDTNYEDDCVTPEAEPEASFN